MVFEWFYIGFGRGKSLRFFFSFLFFCTTHKHIIFYGVWKGERRSSLFPFATILIIYDYLTERRIISFIRFQCVIYWAGNFWTENKFCWWAIVFVWIIRKLDWRTRIIQWYVTQNKRFGTVVTSSTIHYSEDSTSSESSSYHFELLRCDIDCMVYDSIASFIV